MITLTERAEKKIRAELDSKNQKSKKESLPEYVGFRLSVKAGKCSGLSYDFNPTNFIDKNFDEVFESNGVRIYVDKKSLRVVNGTEIDYITSDNLLVLGGFIFNNPNAKASCGCGQSFELK